jgi:hypothetical protein
MSGRFEVRIQPVDARIGEIVQRVSTTRCLSSVFIRFADIGPTRPGFRRDRRGRRRGSREGAAMVLLHLGRLMILTDVQMLAVLLELVRVAAGIAGGGVERSKARGLIRSCAISPLRRWSRFMGRLL